MMGPQQWNGKQPVRPAPAATDAGSTGVSVVGRGLTNLGNTCFMNAVLQCLVHTPPINRYLEKRLHTAKCRARLAKAFCLGCSLEDLMHFTFARGPQSAAYPPRDIATALPDIARGFRLGRQEDAHEFLRCALDRLTKDFTPLAEKAKPAGVTGRCTVLQAWLSGILESQIRCLTCGHESNTYDPFLDLSLELFSPGHGAVDSLDAAVRLFCKEEFLDGANKYKCEHCAGLRRARKQLTLERAPKFLSVQLKRFAFGGGFGGGSGKITSHVAFPVLWDVTASTSAYNCDAASAPQIRYTLYAVLVHEGGTVNSGHYYCYVRGQKPNTGGGGGGGAQWWCLNDSRVKPVAESHVLGASAYMLFYQLLDSAVPPPRGPLSNGQQQPAANGAPQIGPSLPPAVGHDPPLIGPAPRPPAVSGPAPPPVAGPLSRPPAVLRPGPAVAGPMPKLPPAPGPRPSPPAVSGPPGPPSASSRPGTPAVSGEAIGPQLPPGHPLASNTGGGSAASSPNTGGVVAAGTSTVPRGGQPAGSLDVSSGRTDASKPEASVGDLDASKTDSPKTDASDPDASNLDASNLDTSEMDTGGDADSSAPQPRAGRSPSPCGALAGRDECEAGCEETGCEETDSVREAQASYACELIQQVHICKYVYVYRGRHLPLYISLSIYIHVYTYIHVYIYR